MALVKGKYINPDLPIKSNIDPVSGQDLSRKSYVDTKAAAEALSARLQAESFASSAASTAEQTAKSYADQKISDLVNGAPAMLDTLKELADALEASEGSLESQILTQVGLLNSRIDQEILDRQSGDSSEAAARQTADSALQTSIEEEVERATSEEERIEDKVDQEIVDRQSAMSTEVAARIAGDSALQTAIDEEETRAIGEESRIEGKVDAETAARQAADTLLQNAINSEASIRQQELLEEQQAREAADTALSGDISDEVTRATAAEEVLDAKIDQEIFDRSEADTVEQLRAVAEEQRIEAKVDAETAARQGMDSMLDGKIVQESQNRISAVSELDSRLDVLEADPTTKTYVDGKFSDANSYTDQKVSDLVNGAPEMLDTLKELADAIGAQGGSLTEQILTQVGQVDDKIDQEILDRQAGDSSLQSQITQEVSDRQAAVSAEQSRAQSAESSLQSQITQEVSDRQSAVSAEQTRAEAAESALDARVDVLEAEPRPRGQKEIKTLTSSDLSNGYVDLSYEAMEMTVNMSVSAVVKYETEDYNLSVVGGKTRVTFAGELLSNGSSPLESGEKVYFQYMTKNPVSSGGGGSGGSGSEGSGGGSGGGSSSSEVTITSILHYPLAPEYPQNFFEISGAFAIPTTKWHSEVFYEGAWQQVAFNLSPLNYNPNTGTYNYGDGHYLIAIPVPPHMRGPTTSLTRFKIVDNGVESAWFELVVDNSLL